MTEQDVFNVRSKILAAIDECDDKYQRNILLLMFGVLEAQETGLKRIELKIDAVLRDEKAIKKLALNGHEGRHDAHHVWIEQRMMSDCEAGCEWAAKKMKEEADADKNKKSFFQKIYEGAAGKIGEAVVIIAAIALGFSWVK